MASVFQKKYISIVENSFTINIIKQIKYKIDMILMARNFPAAKLNEYALSRHYPSTYLDKECRDLELIKMSV